MPMTTEGHTQFKGWRYCPKENPLSKEQWLTEKRAEKKATRKRAARGTRLNTGTHNITNDSYN